MLAVGARQPDANRRVTGVADAVTVIGRMLPLDWVTCARGCGTTGSGTPARGAWSRTWLRGQGRLGSGETGGSPRA